MSENDHPSVTMQAPDGETVKIDAGIAVLIARLWIAGVETTSSCQGGPPLSDGRGYVVLPKDTDLHAALEVLPDRAHVRTHYQGMASCFYIAEWWV